MDKKELFLQKLKNLFPQNYEEVVKNIQNPKPTVFRVNTLLSSKEEVAGSLKEQGFELIEGPVLGSYVILYSPKRLSETEDFKEGKLYIQSLASMLPVTVLDPKPGERFLDMCAAPGSKTTQAAALADNKLKIFAVENNRNRFFALKENLEKQKVENTKLLMENARMLDKAHPEFIESFDKVLLDAPCSNEGNICLSEPETLERWNPKSAKSLSKLQRGLIMTAARLVKPGGALVYSTCTFSREENEGVVSWLLKKCPDLKLVSQERITPNELFTGFFIAKLEKTP